MPLNSCPSFPSEAMTLPNEVAGVRRGPILIGQLRFLPRSCRRNSAFLSVALSARRTFLVRIMHHRAPKEVDSARSANRGDPRCEVRARVRASQQLAIALSPRVPDAGGAMRSRKSARDLHIVDACLWPA